jgi:hypothetical protein
MFNFFKKPIHTCQKPTKLFNGLGKMIDNALFPSHFTECGEVLLFARHLEEIEPITDKEYKVLNKRLLNRLNLLRGSSKCKHI